MAEQARSLVTWLPWRQASRSRCSSAPRLVWEVRRRWTMAGRFASRPALAIRPRSLPWRAGLADSPRAVAGAHPSDRGLELAMCLPARRLCGCSGADLRVHRTQRSIAA